jgi:hypothetical protein
VEKIKAKVCLLLKEAAQDGLLVGDEPLVVLVALVLKMIHEIKDPSVRRAFTDVVIDIINPTNDDMIH